MVGNRPARASWWIVPYEGDTFFKRVRVRDEARVQTVLRHIFAHECIALVGPANCEKSHLLSDVVGELRRSGRFVPAVADLWQAASTDEAAFFSSLAALISRDLPHPPPLDGPITTPRAFQNFLAACLEPRPAQNLALFVDHLQALPHDLVHALLLSLRATFMEQPVESPARLVAIVAGGMNLVGFSAAPTSPFNIARPVLAGPLTPEQTKALAQATFEAWGFRASASAVERITQWAGGDHYLVPWLCYQSVQRVAGRASTTVRRTTIDKVITDLMGRPTALVPFHEAIKMIEEDPDTLLDVLRILSEGLLQRRQSRQVISRTGLDRLQLSGGFVLAGGQYCIKNDAYRQALVNHFSTERVAHVLRIAGRWREAIEYLGPRLASESDRSARPQLLEAIVQSIYAADSSDEAFELLAQGLRIGFGLPRSRIYCANLSGQTLDLRWPRPAAGDTAPERVDLRDAASVEAQTFLYSLRPPGRTYALRGSGQDARLVAALSTPHRAVGIVAIEPFPRARTRYATHDDLPDLLRFLSHAAGAIENVLDRVAYRRIGQAVLDANTASPALERVLAAVAEALGCDFAGLYLLDDRRELMTLSAAVGLDLEHVPANLRNIHCSDLHPLAVALVVQPPHDHQQPVTVRSPGDRMMALFPGDSQMRSPLLVHLPLYASGSALGLLTLGYSGSLPVPVDSGMSRLTGLADQVAIAVHNVGLLRRTEDARARRVAELEQLRLSSMAVSSTLNLEESLGRIVAGIQSLFPGAETRMWEYLPEQQQMVALQLAGAVEVAPAQPQIGPARNTRRVPTGSGCTLSTDLVSHERTIGLMEVHLPLASEAPLRPGETALLEAFAAQAAVSIENTRFREREAARQRVERELAFARDIQLSLLPGEFPSLLGWDFASIYRAARIVGGDFYDHFLLPGKPLRLGLIIADVADKGIPAALFMALSRTIIRTTALSGRGPASALLRANELLLKDSASDLFLTAAYALVELEGGRMIYANAGHSRPLLYRSASRQLTELPGSGTALGAFESIHLEERRVDLARGDVLVLYTDGVTETQDANGDFFEETRLAEVLRRHADAPAEEIAAAIDEAVLAFQGSADQFDDVACIVAKHV
jgi:serine phosphatase RsbU (regulator of sigma subunit)/uncharacterized protein YigA (DUF484 family)